MTVCECNEKCHVTKFSDAVSSDYWSRGFRYISLHCELGGRFSLHPVCFRYTRCKMHHVAFLEHPGSSETTQGSRNARLRGDVTKSKEILLKIIVFQSTVLSLRYIAIVTFRYTAPRHLDLFLPKLKRCKVHASALPTLQFWRAETKSPRSYRKCNEVLSLVLEI